MDSCCAGTTELDPGLDADSLARTFKALADPTRVTLLALIAAHPEREACICDLTGPVRLSQPTVSHHMKQLVAAGLVTREQRGRWAYYGVVEGAVADRVRPLLDSLAGAAQSSS